MEGTINHRESVRFINKQKTNYQLDSQINIRNLHQKIQQLIFNSSRENWGCYYIFVLYLDDPAGFLLPCGHKVGVFSNYVQHFKTL